MPEVVEDLFRSVLGRAVRGVALPHRLRIAHDLIDRSHRWASEAAVILSHGITADHVRRLFAGPVAGEVAELRFYEEPLGSDGLRALAELLPASLRDLHLSAIG